MQVHRKRWLGFAGAIVDVKDYKLENLLTKGISLVVDIYLWVP